MSRHRVELPIHGMIEMSRNEELLTHRDVRVCKYAWTQLDRIVLSDLFALRRNALIDTTGD